MDDNYADIADLYRRCINQAALSTRSYKGLQATLLKSSSPQGGILQGMLAPIIPSTADQGRDIPTLKSLDGKVFCTLQSRTLRSTKYFTVVYDKEDFDESTKFDSTDITMFDPYNQDAPISEGLTKRVVPKLDFMVVESSRSGVTVQNLVKKWSGSEAIHDSSVPMVIQECEKLYNAGNLSVQSILHSIIPPSEVKEMPRQYLEPRRAAPPRPVLLLIISTVLVE